MIDRTTRDRYAELIRHFVAGQMTNFDYEDRFDRIGESLDAADPAVLEIFEAMWHTYCDIQKHKMTGQHALVDQNRHTVARFVLFLHSDLPYEWPTGDVKKSLLRLLTLGLYGKRKTQGEDQTSGDPDVWPFFRQSDFESAKKNPKLMKSGALTIR